MNKVFVIGGDFSIETMFRRNGWIVVDNPYECDLLQFTGGEDVDPSFYGEAKHATTSSNPRRDAYESHMFRSFIDTPKAGICRGGQFLNIMSGGTLFQNVNNHTTDHRAFNEKEEFVVTSTHHQMIKPSPEALVLLKAKEATLKETANTMLVGDVGEDIESVYYPSTKSFCYQPHPEWMKTSTRCQTFYFEQLTQLFN